jgi:hypothetical protein
LSLFTAVLSAANFSTADDAMPIEAIGQQNFAQLPGTLCNVQEVTATDDWDFATTNRILWPGPGASCGGYVCRGVAINSAGQILEPFQYATDSQGNPTQTNFVHMVDMVGQPCPDMQGTPQLYQFHELRYWRRANLSQAAYIITISALPTQRAIRSIYVKPGRRAAWRAPTLDGDEPFNQTTQGVLLIDDYYFQLAQFTNCSHMIPLSATRTAAPWNISMILGDELVISKLAMRPVENGNGNGIANNTGAFAQGSPVGMPNVKLPPVLCRRGRYFDMTMVTSSAISNCQRVFLFLDPIAPIASPANLVFPIEGSTGGSQSEWRYSLGVPSLVDGAYKYPIRVFVPNQAPVGLWKVYASVLLNNGGTWVVSAKQGDNENSTEGELAILFDPYRETEETFLGAEDRLVYHNSSQVAVINNFQDPVNWKLRQYTAPVAVATLQYVSHVLTPAQRVDAVNVARALVTMVPGDNAGRPGTFHAGILKGNWARTVTVLEKIKALNKNADVGQIFLTYWRNGRQPAEFGQCWMLAPSLAAPLRTMGIPSRIVEARYARGSNGVLGAAIGKDSDYDGILRDCWTWVPPLHPRPFSRAIVRDQACVANRPGYRDRDWNYHVWTEAFLSRPDLPAAYSSPSWQALDASTNIEFIGPSFQPPSYVQIGPASLPAMAAGQFGADIGYETKYYQGLLRPWQIFVPSVEGSNASLPTTLMVPLYLVANNRPELLTDKIPTANPEFIRTSRSGDRETQAFWRWNWGPPIEYAMAVPNPPQPIIAAQGIDISKLISLAETTAFGSNIAYSVRIPSLPEAECDVSCRCFVSIRYNGSAVDLGELPAQFAHVVPGTPSQSLMFVIPWNLIPTQMLDQAVVLVSTTVAYSNASNTILVDEAHTRVASPEFTLSLLSSVVRSKGWVKLRLEVTLPNGVNVHSLRVTCSPTASDDENAFIMPIVGPPAATDLSSGSIDYDLGDRTAGVSIDESFVLRAVLPGPSLLNVQVSGDGMYPITAQLPISVSRCSTDADSSGATTIDDMFWFLNRWFLDSSVGCQWGLETDYNGDGCVTIDDYFIFLNEWFTQSGCAA